jgi:hypothetical protein
MPEFNDSWPIPAYFPWYKSDNTKHLYALNKQMHNRAQTAPDRLSIEKAERFAYRVTLRIEQDMQHWEHLVNHFFISRNSPFPTCTWLHKFLADPLSFGTEFNRGDYIEQKQHYSQ